MAKLQGCSNYSSYGHNPPSPYSPDNPIIDIDIRTHVCAFGRPMLTEVILSEVKKPSHIGWLNGFYPSIQ